MKTIHTRLLAVLPSLKALGRWLALAGLTGLACGLAGAAFTWTVGWSTALRGAHPWLLFCMPLTGLVIVWAYRAAGMENDSGTNQIIASVRGGERPPVRLAPLIFLGSALTPLTGGSAGREGAALQDIIRSFRRRGGFCRSSTSPSSTRRRRSLRADRGRDRPSSTLAVAFSH